ncbi:hypothetical protein C0214_09435 [Methylobacterium sp. DM1]|nr:hypothetical protein C0214_09435 [Methylobacterium sp. DM1]
MVPMTDTAPSRETSAAARRRIAAADRAREWRERQRETEAARVAELDALKAEVTSLRAERNRLQAALGKPGATGIDEDLARAFVRMGGIRRSAAGPLAIANPKVDVADVIAVAGYIRSGGRPAGQTAFDAARKRVLERLAQFLPSPGEA